jgi:hypothetical protein
MTITSSSSYTAQELSDAYKKLQSRIANQIRAARKGGSDLQALKEKRKQINILSNEARTLVALESRGVIRDKDNKKLWVAYQHLS